MFADNELFIIQRDNRGEVLLSCHESLHDRFYEVIPMNEVI